MNGQVPCRVCTFNSSAVIKILQADNVTKVTIEVVVGPVLMTGNAQFANSNSPGNPIASAPISLATGIAFVFASGGPEAPIDNLTFDCTGGSCNFVMQM